MSSRDKDIFLEAAEIEDPDRRSSYLNDACDGDLQLRRQVDALLRSLELAEGFLETPAVVEQFDIADPDSLSFLAPSEQDGSLGRIGHFEVESVLGEGGAGIVFKAFDNKLNRHVAIKVLSPFIAVNRKARTRFIGEAHAAAAISHPHVAAIYAIGEHNQLPYLVMEYVKGNTLEQKIQDEVRLGMDTVLRIGIQIAQGLAAAHEQGLIHRDIKPANVLLTQGSEYVKITDFGLARAVDDNDITQAGLLSGTPQYMSPEQATGQPLDQRTDLFSLGCVLYAMCAGQSPFKADSTIATIRRLCDEMPPAISAFNPSAPDRFVVLISKLLAKKPDDRHQSVQEIVSVLEACHRTLKDPGGESARASISQNKEATHSAVAPSQEDRGKRGGRKWIGKAAPAGVLAIAALAFISETAGWTSIINRNQQASPQQEPADTTTQSTSNGQPLNPEAVDGLFESLTSDRYRWTEPTNLGEPINSEYDESYPRLSADGLLLVFVSNRPAPSSEGSNGDIWMASRPAADAPFGEPFHLGPAINSDHDEHQPSISGDGLILVFARRMQFGAGYELWTSTRESRDSPWTPATPMGLGFDGPHQFNAFANLSADGLTLDYVSFKPVSGPFVNRRSVRRSIDQPWPDPQEFDLLPDLPDNQLVSYVTVSSNDLAVLYRTRDDNVLLVRESINSNWVTVSMPDEMLTPNNAPGGNAFERHFSADGRTMVYDAKWYHNGIGGRDIWMIQRVAN